MQRIQVSPADAKTIQAKPNIDKSIRAKTLAQLQCVVSAIIPEKDVSPALELLYSQLDSQAMAPAIAESMLDIARVAWLFNCRDLAIKSCAKAETEKNLSPLLRCKIDVCKALKIVADIAFDSANEILQQRLTIKQTEGYAVERRIEAIKILERVLTIIVARCDDNCFLQEICVNVWNIGYVLLQPHLRKFILRTLQLASSALERICSPLQQLRAQIYLELSKAEEQNDFISKALEEGQKALNSDYGELNPAVSTGDDPKLVVPPDLDRFRILDKNLKPFISLLTMRCDVYNQPSGTEDQVLLLIQQAKESSSKSFQIDMLSKATMRMRLAMENNPEMNHSDSDSLSVTSKMQSFAVPETPLEEIAAAVKTLREGAAYNEFKNLVHKRVNILATLAHLAHSHRHDKIVQATAPGVLRFNWDPTDSHVRG
jgi:tetratricopeptide (TPR) repeat protein